MTTDTGDTMFATPTEALPRLYGVIDVLRADRIAGWAIDRTDASAALDVEIRRNGRVVATVCADHPRPDLLKTGVGSGRYGFAADLDPPLEPGFEFTVGAIARAMDGANLELGRSGPRDRDADRRLIERLSDEVAAIRESSAAPIAELSALVDRLEQAQSRLESMLGRAEVAEGAGAGPNLVLGLALTTAGVSIGLGVLSLVWL